MKINHVITFASLFLCAPCLHAETESTEPPHPINTLQMSVHVIGKMLSNSHYKVIGECSWLDGKPIPKLVVTPSIEQYLPDLVVTVSNKPEENPWFEAGKLFDVFPGGKPLGSLIAVTYDHCTRSLTKITHSVKHNFYNI